MKAAAVVADVVVLAAVAVAAAAGNVAGIAAGWTVGESTEARLQTWYEDSERPCVWGKSSGGGVEGGKGLRDRWGETQEEKETGRGEIDRCLGRRTRG
jgi:hypothetical protein